MAMGDCMILSCSHRGYLIYGVGGAYPPYIRSNYNY
jgi:hypothetical protein